MKNGVIKEIRNVEMYTIQGNYICTFETLRKAAEFLVENNHSKNRTSAKVQIYNIANNKPYQKTVSGFLVFKYK